MRFYYLLLALSIGLFLTSCGGDDFDCDTLEKNIGETCDDQDANTENDVVTADCACVGTAIEVPVTYTSHIKDIFDASCNFAPCHGEGSSIFELHTYENAKAAAGFGRLLGAINQEAGFSAMPPNGTKLSDEDIANITEWIDNDTPE